uniref:Uncharacterized protein n=1 Tax=Physcomitrium patens TaxID=3218 RepID=A0A2K1KTT7_PHYPA|nr:hypothetical protein PHYPA_004159 [Physcomitrium patens]
MKILIGQYQLDLIEKIQEAWNLTQLNDLVDLQFRGSYDKDDFFKLV